MVPKIWGVTDRKMKILKNENFEKMKKLPGDIIILHTCAINEILDRFLPFYPTNNSKNQNFETMKKMFGDIIILPKCTKNYYHMLSCSLDMVRNGCHFYFLFWVIFCPFSSLTATKSKFFKKREKHLEIWSLYICVPKNFDQTIRVPEIWCATDGRTERRTDRRTIGRKDG